MSAERPVAAGDSQVAASGVALDAEDLVLGAVVVPAEALAVLGAGRADRPRHRMVLVRASGGAVAAGEHAGPVAGFEVAAQPCGNSYAVPVRSSSTGGLHEPVEQVGGDPRRCRCRWSEE